MAKFNKTLIGLASFLATSVAVAGGLFAPVDASAFGARVDTLNVYVTNNYPSITFSSVKSDDTDPNTLSANLFYGHAADVDVVVSSVDASGNQSEVAVAHFNPETMDKGAEYGSGYETIKLDLASLGLDYGTYALTAKSNSEIGYAEDTVEFAYSPVNVSVLSSLEAAASKTATEKSNKFGITSEDYTITASIAFFAIVVCALSAIKRIEKRTPRAKNHIDIILPDNSFVLSRGTATIL